MLHCNLFAYHITQWSTHFSVKCYTSSGKYNNIQILIFVNNKIPKASNRYIEEDHEVPLGTLQCHLLVTLQTFLIPGDIQNDSERSKNL